jgi:uncharacterized SAM-binding protein YcdF (DUF218 family)
MGPEQLPANAGNATEALRPRRWLARLPWLLVPLLLLAVLYLARGWLLPGLAHWLDVAQPPARVDYVFVLGGGSEIRPFVAAALVEAGFARKVLLVEVQRPPETELGLVPAEHEVNRSVLLAGGVPAAAIEVLPGTVRSTRDEAGALTEFLASRPDASVAVVTNGYHTRRARLIFHRALGERSEQVRFVGAPVDGFDESNWWRCEAGFRCYATEYGKLISSWLRD